MFVDHGRILFALPVSRLNGRIVFKMVSAAAHVEDVESDPRHHC